MQKTVLSTSGSSRATAFGNANRIVTFEGKTHVAWLDSTDEEGFVVRVRTLDRQSGEWSDATTAGRAVDNHGAPSLTVDQKGYLHLAYGPHHHPAFYTRSRRPNEATAWEEPVTLGDRLTYPNLFCGADGTVFFAARQSHQAGSEGQWSLVLYLRPPGEDWYPPVELLRASEKGYLQCQDAFAWSPDRQRLHLVYKVSQGQQARPSQYLGYLYSDDGGLSWNRPLGEEVSMPASPNAGLLIEEDHRENVSAYNISCGNAAVDRGGMVHTVYALNETPEPGLWLASLSESGQWQRQSLLRWLPEESRRCTHFPGGFTITSHGEYFVTLSRSVPAEPGQHGFLHPTSEVFLLHSADEGRSFKCLQASPGNPMQMSAMPSLERVTGHNYVPETPLLIYTAGDPAGGLKEITANSVIAVRV